MAIIGDAPAGQSLSCGADFRGVGLLLAIDFKIVRLQSIACAEHGVFF